MKNNYVPLKNKFLLGSILLFFIAVMHFNSKAQVTYSFTSAGVTGSLGPTQAQVNTAYTLTNLNGSVAVSGIGLQSFTIPVTGLYRVTAIGAQGAGADGGKGAVIGGDFNFTAGDVLRIIVGQQGVTQFGEPNACGGGGGSYVLTGVGNTTSNIVVIAGGGGGSPASYTVSRHASLSTSGNYGAGVNNTDGAGGTNGNGGNKSIAIASLDRGAGGGGFFTDGQSITQSAGAANGGSCFINGGGGGTHNSTGAAGGFGGGGAVWTTGFRGAGGGGGYSGGGGGQTNANANTQSGGGGGSFNNGANQTNSLSTGFGDGSVIVTRLCNITLGTNTGSNLLCIGAAVTLTTNAISNYTWSDNSNGSSLVVSPAVTTSYTLTAMSPSLCITSAVITITVSGGVPILTVTASSPSVCLGNSVSISASGAITYTFSGGISNAVPFFPTATTVYTVTGQNGCGTTSSLTTITIASLPVSGIASPTVVCAGSTSTLTGNGATTYTWMPGPIVSIAAIVSPVANTIYTVVGVTGSCMGIYTIAVNVNPIPILTVSASSGIICQGESATLTASGASGYTWQPGNLIGSTVVVTPSIPTAFIVTGDNSFGCTASAQQPVVVFASPTVAIGTSASTICPGNSVSLSASGANTYIWNTGANTANISVSPATTTVYSVVGTNTTTQCTDTKTIEISVFVSSLAINSPSAVCVGSSATLTASGANLYQWSGGGSGNSIVVNPTSATSYTVNGIHSVGGGTCGSSASVMLLVNQLPTITIASTRTIVCRDLHETATFTASGAQTYSWVLGSTGAVVTVTPPATVNTYSVVGTDQNSCTNTQTIIVKGVICIGLPEKQSKLISLQVFPNPSNGELNISSESNLELILVNELGQSLQQISLNDSNEHKIRLKDLTPGIYFLNTKEPKLRINKKIIVLE